jgi:NDP-sugar pyrophosphorylase family protein
MRGFILAAGLGTRLRPWTDRVPKPLVEIGGEPLIERAVRQLAKAGVRDIGVNLFHLGEQIRDRMGDGRQLGVRLTWFDERPEILGTGGGLKNAETFLRGGTAGAFLLVNGDVWHDFDLSGVIASHQPGSLATLAMHRTARRPELHTVGCTKDGVDVGRIVHIGGKPAPQPHDFMAIYTGIAVYGVQMLDWLPARVQSGLVSHGLLPAMQAGVEVRWVEPQGAWYDCGTPSEVLRASHYALSQRSGSLARAALIG